PVGSLVGNNVTTTQAAYNVPIQQVTQDSQLVPSLIKFRTDSSAVFIVYVSGCCVPDGIRPDRVGGRAILNAFELKLTSPGGPMPACWNWPTQCHGDTDNTNDVKGSDFLALKNSWYKVYGVDAEYDPCADFDRNGEVKGSDFLILKNNWYQTVPADTWPPQP
ncbi:MAG: dockerin type I domain-containing protein, partial [Planctomycetota bacterium]